MNIVFKNVYFFLYRSKSSMNERKRERKRVRGERMICSNTVFSLSFGHWLASSNLIEKKKKTGMCMGMCTMYMWNIQSILFSIKCILYIQRELTVVNRSAHLCLIQNARIKLYMICGEKTHALSNTCINCTVWCN